MTQVFISYSRRDLDFVEQLASDLKATGLDVWYDLSGLEGGQRWRIEIEKAIRKSQYVLVVLSPDSVASEWVEREYLFSNNLGKKIIPLFYKQCDLPMYYLNVHFIDVQGVNYKKNYSEILRTIGVVQSPIPKEPSIPDKKVFTSLGIEDKKQADTQPKPVAINQRDQRNLKPYGFVALSGVVMIVLVFGLFKLIQKIPVVVIGTPTRTLLVVPTLDELNTPTRTPIIVPTPIELNTPTQMPMIVPTLRDPDTPTATPLPTEIVDDFGVEMVLVLAGEFTMGSNDADADERPAHQVYIDTYYIDKYEVTNSFYKACVTQSMCIPPNSPNRLAHLDYYSNSRFDNYPVIDVDWNMAKTYCEWRNSNLPSEAQWEKAARGVDGRTYPWGEGLGSDCNKANKAGCFEFTIDVYSLDGGASPYGVFNMAGNVWEWVADWYSESYYQNSPTANPFGPDNGQLRVIRGGSFSEGSSDVRSTTRRGTNPESSSAYLGFRCARDATP